LKLMFLIVTRAVSLLGLSRREWWWKDAEILMLRHQLAVAERERPRAHSRLTWPDRAWLALLAGTVPAERLAAMRLIVTPAPGPRRAPGNASQGAVGGAAAGPGERVVGIPADPRRARGARHRGGAVHGHRTVNQAAPLRPLPDGVTDLDQFRVQRRDRAGGVIHEYRLVA
jgi:hypothetical protein